MRKEKENRTNNKNDVVYVENIKLNPLNVALLFITGKK
jgi:hypothetical protein